MNHDFIEYVIVGVFVAAFILVVGLILNFSDYLVCRKHYPNEALLCTFSSKYRVVE